MSKMLDALRQLRSRGVDFTPEPVLETLDARTTSAPLNEIEDVEGDETNVTAHSRDSEINQDIPESSVGENSREISAPIEQELETLRAANGGQSDVVVEYPSDESLRDIWYCTESSSVDPDIGIEVREYRVISPDDSRAGEFEQSVRPKTKTPIDITSLKTDSPDPSTDHEDADDQEPIRPSGTSLVSTVRPEARVTSGLASVLSRIHREQSEHDSQPLTDSRPDDSALEIEHASETMKANINDRPSPSIGHAEQSRPDAHFDHHEQPSTTRPVSAETMNEVNENLEQIFEMVDSSKKELGFKCDSPEEMDSSNTVAFGEGVTRPANEDLPAAEISEPNALASGARPESAVIKAPDASAFGSVESEHRATQEHIDEDPQHAGEVAATIEVAGRESGCEVDQPKGNGHMPIEADVLHDSLDDVGPNRPLLSDNPREAARLDAAGSSSVSTPDQELDTDSSADQTKAEKSLHLILGSLEAADVPSNDDSNFAEPRQTHLTEAKNAFHDRPLPSDGPKTGASPVESDYDFRLDHCSSEPCIPKDVDKMVEANAPGNSDAPHEVPEFEQTSDFDALSEFSAPAGSLPPTNDASDVIGAATDGEPDISGTEANPPMESEGLPTYSEMLLEVPPIKANPTEQHDVRDDSPEQWDKEPREHWNDDFVQSTETSSTGQTSGSTQTAQNQHDIEDEVDVVVSVNNVTGHHARPTIADEPLACRDEKTPDSERTEEEELAVSEVAKSDARDPIDSAAGSVDVSDELSVTREQECETTIPNLSDDCQFTGQFDSGILEPLSDSELKQRYIEAADSLNRLADGRPLVLMCAGVDDDDHVAETLLRLTAILIERDAGRILLVDANASDQTMSSRLEVTGRPGIGDICKLEFHWQDTLICNVDPCLSFIPRGRCVPPITSANILSSIVAEWKREFPFILIDGGNFSTPLAQDLAHLSDASSLIVRLGKTDRKKAAETVQRMKRLENFVGTVITT